MSSKSAETLARLSSFETANHHHISEFAVQKRPARSARDRSQARQRQLLRSSLSVPVAAGLRPQDALPTAANRFIVPKLRGRLQAGGVITTNNGLKNREHHDFEIGHKLAAATRI
jgi:hypothetical protein